MKTLSYILILSTILFAGCEEYEGLQYKRYLILEGLHESDRSTEFLTRNFLVFDVIFDETAIYESKDPVNQKDVNKLFGFADCNSFHHVNSVRFGWRWDPEVEMVEILLYAYVDSKRIIKSLTFVGLNESHRYEIILSDDHYYVRTGKSKIILDRNKICDKGEYYLLWPYFGGDETAPHNISIYMRRHIRSTWRSDVP